MNYLKERFKGRTIGFWLGLGAAAAALTGNIAFIILAYGDKVFSIAVFILILVGVLSQGLVIFTDFKFAPLAPLAFFAVAAAINLYVGLPSMSDIWNGVVFIGGRGDLAIVFSIVFFAVSAVSSAACYMQQKKELKTK